MIRSYFSDVSAELNRRSNEIRSWFATHRPSAGQSREDLVSKFLNDYLPDAFEISSGLILSSNGEFSSQADVIISDKISNRPLFRHTSVPIWLVESVYALLEIKTSLKPDDLQDAISKCRRFKELERHFGDSFGRQSIVESMFILWAFEAPSNQTAKSNILTAIHGIAFDNLPDFIIVPGRFVFVTGQYRRLAEIGQPDSPYWREKVRISGSEEAAIKYPYLMYDLGDDSILVLLYWVTSWLMGAGSRRADILKYLPSNCRWETII